MNELTLYSPPSFRAEIARDPHLKSEHSKRLYASALAAFETWRASRPLTKTLVEEYISTLQAGHSPNTLKLHVAAIKWWVRRIVDLAYEQLPPEQAQNVALQAERVSTIRPKDITRGERKPAGRHIPDDQLARLLETCQADPRPQGARDAAMIAAAIPTGARNAEIRMITIADMRYDGDGVVVRIAHGKGDREREAYLVGNALAAVNAWLDVRGAAPGYLFCRILYGRPDVDHPITYEGTRKILHERFVQSGIRQSISWHDFRRTLVGNLLEAGEDIPLIQSITGHKSGETVKRYDRRPEEARREAVSRVNVPYKANPKIKESEE